MIEHFITLDNFRSQGPLGLLLLVYAVQLVSFHEATEVAIIHTKVDTTYKYNFFKLMRLSQRVMHDDH